MQYIIFEDESTLDLRPLTWTRGIYDIRVGIDRIRKKWSRILPEKVILPTSEYDREAESIFINGKFVPGEWVPADLARAVPSGTAFVNENDEVVFARCNHNDFTARSFKTENIDTTGAIAIRRPTDIFQNNKACIEYDLSIRSQTASYSGVNDPHSRVYGADNVFVEEGATIKAAIINAEDGPIFIGRNANIGEGAIIHGAHAICENGTISMGAKMRGDSTVGPWCKVGGEVGNSVFMGYSNKAHDGYVGNSVIGYWCNLGADTNTSNLKNNYTNVKLWSYREERFVDTGTIFCGLIMGDHAKCGINTMFNTGTVVGVGANIFGGGYPRNFLPDFCWGGSGGLITHRIEKAVELAKIVMARRKMELSNEDEETLRNVYEETSKYRTWEKNT